MNHGASWFVVMRCDALQRFLFQLISVVARPILVVGSKSYLVHQGKMVQQHCSCLDMGPIIAEVQSRGNLCWAAQCILLRVLAKTCWFWAVPPSNAHPATPTVATTLILINYCVINTQHKMRMNPEVFTLRLLMRVWNFWHGSRYHVEKL